MQRLMQSLEEECENTEQPQGPVNPQEMHCSYEVVKFMLYKEEIETKICRLGLPPVDAHLGQERDVMQRIRNNLNLKERLMSKIKLYRESEKIYYTLIIKEAPDNQYYALIQAYETRKK